ncbi:MAG: SH3 domain-containing protein [Candidatus Dormibacteria bacterium]
MRTGALAALASLGLAGCALSSPPPARHQPRPSATPSATPTPLPQAVTVIAPDGVNFRTNPSTTAAVVGVVAQGVTLPVISQTSVDGGWWQVKGSTATGWITSNPAYTSTASFQSYQSTGTPAWSALFPTSWTFAQTTAGTISFTGSGGQVITVTSAATTANLPPGAPTGTGEKSVTSVDVYGITTALVTYASSTGYLAAVAFQARPGVAFLITAKGSSSSTAAQFTLFLDAFKFALPAPTPKPTP